MSQTNPKSAKASISRYLRGELRRTFSVWAYGKVHVQGGMQKKTQESMLYNLYHGSDKYPSHIGLILEGKGPYTEIYTTTQVLNNSPSQPSSNLAIKDIFAKKESIKYVKPYVHITKQVLERASFTGPALIQGRALLALAHGSLRTIRKALAILLSKVDDNMKPKRSGESMDDVWNQVLDELYIQLNGKACVVEDASPPATQEDVEEEQEEGTTTVRPDNWLPDGWMALRLFGPTAPAANQINLLQIGQPKDAVGGGKKKRGRAASREEQKEEKKKAREADSTGERGVSIGHRIGLAGLIINRKNLEIETREQVFMTKHYHANRLIDSISQQISIIQLFPEGSDDRKKATETLLRLQDQRDLYNDRLQEQLENREKELIEKLASADYLAGCDEVINSLTPKMVSDDKKPAAKKDNSPSNNEDVVDNYPISLVYSPNGVVDSDDS